MGLTTDPNDPSLRKIKSDGQQEVYLVLTEEERAKGFVRPVRRSYIHVGPPGPKFLLRDLTDIERENYASVGYVKFEAYPEGYQGSVIGRYWTQEQLNRIDKGCGAETTMGTAIAETYARNPHYYGATFCCGCGKHLPVGEGGEFIWSGTNERVGT